MQDFFKSDKVDDFIKFRKMITPAIIQVLFWVVMFLDSLHGLADGSFGRRCFYYHRLNPGVRFVLLPAYS